MDYRGGFGINSWGRSEYGNAKSDIEPRFLFSRPSDGQVGVDRDAWLKFSLYMFSSWVNLSDLYLEVSEDGGVIFTPAYDGSDFLAPYNGVTSNIFHESSQVISFIIVKNDLWPPNELIQIRCVGQDNYGQDVTKNPPVTWG